MTDGLRLLHLAVEDNVAWCSAVCAGHGLKETRSSSTWANLAASPRFYPNIISRKSGAEQEVNDLIGKVREAHPSRSWGIKDSFAELDLVGQGFERVLAGHWYGGMASAGSPTGWKTVETTAGLSSWEGAWGACDDRIFPDSLLEDHRTSFWYKGPPEAIEAGFISFGTEFSLGLSNWFSRENQSFAQIGVLQAAASVARGRPIVCWSTDDLRAEGRGLAELGPLQVWISS